MTEVELRFDDANMSDEHLNASMESQEITAIPRCLWMLSNLLSVNVSNNRITNAEPLLLLRNLRHLDISGNRLYYFRAVPAFPHLEVLNCSRNSISIVQLHGCASLRKACFSNNKITMLNGFYGCQALASLDLENNLVLDVSQFVYLKHSRLKWLSVAGNAVSAQTTAICKLLPQVSFQLQYNIAFPRLCIDQHLHRTDSYNSVTPYEASFYGSVGSPSDSRKVAAVEQKHTSKEGSPHSPLNDPLAADSTVNAAHEHLKIVDFIPDEPTPKSAVYRPVTYMRTPAEGLGSSFVPNVSSSALSCAITSSASVSVIRLQPSDSQMYFAAKSADAGCKATSETKQSTEEKRAGLHELASGSIVYCNAADTQKQFLQEKEPLTGSTDGKASAWLAQTTERRASWQYPVDASQDTCKMKSLKPEQQDQPQQSGNAQEPPEKREINENPAGEASHSTDSKISMEVQESPRWNPAADAQCLKTAVYTPMESASANPFKQLIPDIPLTKLNDYYQPSSPNVSARLYGKQLLSLSDSESEGLTLSQKSDFTLQPPESNQSTLPSENYTDDFGKRSAKQSTNVDLVSGLYSAVYAKTLHEIPPEMPLKHAAAASDSAGYPSPPEAHFPAARDALPLGSHGCSRSTSPQAEKLAEFCIPEQPRPHEARQWYRGQNGVVEPEQIIEVCGQQFRKIVKKKRPYKSVFKH